ncbi:hypothetical protein TNCV_4384081 [Trichonephila clavipes]|nr:hypothetical protein TNCV_4384081 [Trichonephila clavipes]
MIMKLEETGDLDVPGRGRKPDRSESLEEVATAVIERASSYIYSSASGSISVTRFGVDHAYCMIWRFQRLHHVDLSRIPF